MSLLSMTWFSVGLFVLFAVAFRQMAGGRNNTLAVLSLVYSAVAFALRAVFCACGNFGTAVAPNNPFAAVLVQFALVLALIGALFCFLQLKPPAELVPVNSGSIGAR